MTGLRAQTIDTPDGPFTTIEDAEGAVLASGWDAEPAVVARRARLGEVGRVSGGARSAKAVWAYYEGDLEAVASIVVAARSTAFQGLVWRHLRGMSPGTVASYGEVADALGRPGSARAVASACARNPCGLFVPCHRVIAANGGLAGFAWGLPVKQSLLRREGVVRAEF